MKLGNSLTKKSKTYYTYLYIMIIQNYTRLYKILQDYTRWFSQGSPTFSWCFPNVFQWISLQDSELHGLRRPSGYPIHDRRTSAPFRTEGATGLRQMGTTRSHDGHECHDISGSSNSSIFCIFQGLKTPARFYKKLLQHVKHHETPPSYCDEFQG